MLRGGVLARSYIYGVDCVSAMISYQSLISDSSFVIPLSFSFFISVGITHFATTSVVRVVIDFFYQSGCIEVFY